MTNELKEFEKLESALLRAGREMEYPATPAIASRVREELLPWQQPARRNWLRLLVPIAVAIIMALALLFALPNARDAVGQFLGLRGLEIFYVTPTPAPTDLPTSAPTVMATPGIEPTASVPPRPTMTPTTSAFVQCCETTLAKAKRRASFPLLLPPNQTPGKVYYQQIFEDGEQVIMVFGDPENPEFTLYQAHRWVYGKLIGKGVGSQTLLSETDVNGERALWFSGAPHMLVMMDQFGQRSFEPERVVGENTLVWETGDMDRGIIYRVETNQSLERAREFAEGLKEVTP